MSGSSFGPTIAEIAHEVRQRVAAFYALSMFGDHRGSADVADQIIAELCQYRSDQLAHVIEHLAGGDLKTLAQMAVQVAYPAARTDAEAIHAAATDAIYGSEDNPTPTATDPFRKR